MIRSSKTWRAQRLGWVALAPLVVAGLSIGAQGTSSKLTADEQALKAANVGIDGTSILSFLKSRTLTAQDRESVEALITQLGASSFKARDQASTELIAKGPVALEALRQGLTWPDAEVQRRCEAAIKMIKEADKSSAVTGAAVRLLGAKKPPGAVVVLLNYAPFADESVVDDIRAALATLIAAESQIGVFIEALADKGAMRRWLAGDALVRAGKWQDHAPKVRALLQDEDAQVRLRVATALVAKHDRDAVPTLIDLLPVVSMPRAWEIEETLYQLAGPKSPPIVLGKNEATRTKCRDAWRTWWKESGAKVDMANVQTQRTLGFTTVIFLDESRIIELYPNDEVRWRIDNLDSPLDVQVLAANRVLIAEHQGFRVTERTFAGEIVWQHSFPDGPQMAQRLPNGNTFIGGRYRLVEVDTAGKEILNVGVPEGIMKCMKLPSDEIVCLSETNRLIRLDAKGREKSSIRVEFGVPLFGGRLHAFPDGRVLVPLHHHDRLVELDAKGKVIWQVGVAEPIAATRLANGNTIVTSMKENRAIEFDKAGKEVWQYEHTTRVTRAIRR